MRTFGSADDYSLGTIISWLESQIEDEAEKPVKSKAQEARLDTAYDALTLLQQVDDWTPGLTREWIEHQRMRMRPQKNN
jgi:hypothetical protein